MPPTTDDIAIVTPIEVIQALIAGCRYDLDRWHKARERAERDRDVAEAHVTEIRMSLMRLEEIIEHIKRLDAEDSAELDEYHNRLEADRQQEERANG